MNTPILYLIQTVNILLILILLGAGGYIIFKLIQILNKLYEKLDRDED